MRPKTGSHLQTNKRLGSIRSDRQRWLCCRPCNETNEFSLFRCGRSFNLFFIHAY
ncbi:hypothetical protein RBWH47_02026 [Rhodopirellula baltica WH47]|uniref:Uncharacterized protein n=1 Tax=Rhodopirellula baltica WH47 TaxID=991778 RepID=F2AZU1_RHOBT|nr:hypothetical protein RBWH47_02026 [Rhodopirellula baltica WH47]